MTIRRTEIQNSAGIHVRPTGLVVQAARNFPCDISIYAKGMDADCKDHFGLLALGLIKGDQVEIRAQGETEEAAANALADLFRREFDFQR